MSQEGEKLKYSAEELKEFEALILEKLEVANRELKYYKQQLSKRDDEGNYDTTGAVKVLEDGAETAEKENYNQLAGRQQKFISQLEKALIRIKNGTYGICVDTGKLISKERLRLVPHTQQTTEAKIARDK